VGRDRPALLPHLLARLAALVSADTGVAHLAAALGVATVTLFGPTDPAPRAPTARVLAPGAPCAPCFRSRCPIDHVCMRAIAADTVAAEVREALA
jgi:ADP-heptose:LPS heptosyltransferase